tara:strand:+ start:3168 stop:3455 length:288 start_codon:yes stop_codon:yes gene_type:complete
MISWRTDGSAGAVDLIQGRLDNGTNSQYYEEKYGMSYENWATNNGRINYKTDVVAGDLIITEEWNITREEYDALDITPSTSAGLPMVETNDHLSF